MPKKLAKLSKLQVLKGFVVGDTKDKYSCTLDDLAKLPDLTKLSIYTGMKSFPTNEHVSALAKLKRLLKLTIAWGGGALQDKADHKLPMAKSDDGEEKKKENGLIDTAKKRKVERSLSILPTMKLPTPPPPPPPPTLPSRLEKLDLKCIPERKTEGWLKPANLKGLKKLYIRGGKFFDLGQFQELDDEVVKEKDSWKVEQLRLKYLTELEMDWTKLQELFPKLIYLEKVECPKLSFFPCDESGVWSVDEQDTAKVEVNAE
ncbi:unnamed protein product [Ilex paraguariensis]|uniref:Uncharacterized protein n=1 Tax=Ilex paraguariensis TaxID=185542 RepID=A0ABC8UCZ3_9AQUA